MTPHLISTRPLKLMITRIRRRLIHDIRRRPPQLHPLPPKPHIPDPRNVLVPIPEVVREEQTQPPHSAELCPLDIQLLHLGRLRELKSLRPLALLGDPEVDVVAVDDDFERLGG